MSSAYFCDKCGQSYPYENITVIKAYRHNGDSRRLGGERRLVGADLCPSCILKLDEWLCANDEAKSEVCEHDKNKVLDKIDEIITDALDKSTDQKESQTLRWVLDKISEVEDGNDD